VPERINQKNERRFIMNYNEKLFKDLLACDWLSNCGHGDIAYDFGVKSAKNAEIMKKNITSLKWENMCLDENGNLSEYMFINRKDEYNKYWNTGIRMLKKLYIPQVMNKISECDKEGIITKEIADDMSMNILSILIADYFSILDENDFFNKLLVVYLSGHLPCGWYGNYPEGEIIIY